jgi:hypothetical protein
MANMRQIQNIAFQRMFQCQHDQTELIYILIKKEENREKKEKEDKPKKEKKPKEDKPKKEKKPKEDKPKKEKKPKEDKPKKEKKPKEDKPKKELITSTLLAQKAAGYLLATANAAKREIAASKK